MKKSLAVLALTLVGVLATSSAAEARPYHKVVTPRVTAKARVNMAALCGPTALAPSTIYGRRFQIAFCELDAQRLNPDAARLGACHRAALAHPRTLSRECALSILKFNGPRHARQQHRA